MRGYFGIGILHTKTEANVGTLWRSAYLYGAAFIFTIGRRYKAQCSDTPKTPRHIPLYEYDTIEELRIPHDCPLIGIELAESAIALPEFKHPERAIYLLGAEDHGLTKEAIDRCHQLVQIPSLQPQSLNVASAGTVLMYDRFVKSAG
jgi:tRNA G18 (ribose-2'-O)-methylase SpoU